MADDEDLEFDFETNLQQVDEKQREEVRCRPHCAPRPPLRTPTPTPRARAKRPPPPLTPQPSPPHTHTHKRRAPPDRRPPPKQQAQAPPDLTAEEIGQQPGNFKKNYRQTVCTYWLRGMCMKGDGCGFLHQFDNARMPVCRSLLKSGKCVELDCPFKHDLEQIKECNMFKLGFCVYGPQCRYRHTRLPGPPPPIDGVEGAKPREFRDLNAVMNEANPGVVPAVNPAMAKRRMMLTDGRGGGGRGRGRVGGGGGWGPPMALPAAGGGGGGGGGGGDGGYGGGGGGGGGGYGGGQPPPRRGMPAGVGFGGGGGGGV